MLSRKGALVSSTDSPVGAWTQHRPAPDPTLSADDVLRSARELVPLLRSRAVQTDRERRIGEDVYRQMQDAGLFHILKPKEYGGLELTEHEHARVTLTLASGCASTAWVYSILAGDNTLILVYPDEVRDEIFDAVGMIEGHPVGHAPPAVVSGHREAVVTERG